MNDIAKKATADKFLRALEKEQLTKSEAGACIGFEAPQVSYLFNEKYWERLGITYWDKLLAWVNSGQSLKEYSEKHGKVLPVEKPVSKKILDPVAEALWEQRVRNVAKEKEFKHVAFTPEMKDKIETAERLAKHPYFSNNENTDYMEMPIDNNKLCQLFARVWLEMIARDMLVPFLKNSGYSGKLTKEIIF